jgi:uncharacterized membrane protein YoaK (UPF0700 family)
MFRPIRDAHRDLAFLLSTIAGSVDAITFLGMNGLFAAHITGNLVILASYLLSGNPAIVSKLCALPVFMAVVLSMTVLIRLCENARRPVLSIMLLGQFIFLAGSAVVSISAGPWQTPNAPLAVLAGMLAVAAMAVQNALVIGVLKDEPATAVMTMNVSRLMSDLAVLITPGKADDRDAALLRARRILPVVIGFVCGCALGAVLQAYLGLRALIVPATIALLATAGSVQVPNRGPRIFEAPRGFR